VLTQTTSLTQDYRQFNFQYAQSWITGTSAAFSFNNGRNRLNSATPLLNPFPERLARHPGQPEPAAGRNIAVNNRNILVARNNMKVTDLQVKLQVATTVARCSICTGTW